MRAGIKTPHQLLGWIASLPATQKTSLECGAGNAELAQFLAFKFQNSVAMDIHPIGLLEGENTKVLQGTCNKLPFKNESIDLVISMQALHHFDVQSHLTEAHRVLKTGGIFTVLCWGEARLPRKIKMAYQGIFDAIEPFWEHARKWVLTGYDGVAFEGDRITLPKSFMKRRMTIDELELEIFKMSATQKAISENIDIPDAQLSEAEFDSIGEFEVRWPILGRIFRRQDV